MTKPLARPGGAPPPEDAELPGGDSLALAPLAAEITRRYTDVFPDEDEHYTPEWREWCTHDNQHVLRWAIDGQRGLIDLWQQISWLARLLEARGYPLDRLARSLELGADVLEERVGTRGTDAAQALRIAATQVAAEAQR